MIDQVADPEPMRAVNSASKTHARAICPGSAAAEAAEGKNVLAEDDDSEWSREGTMLHWYDAHPDAPRDQLSDEQRAALDKNKSLRDQYLSGMRERYGIPANADARLFLEREFLLCDEDGFPVETRWGVVPGHSDIIVYFPEHALAVVFDSKFGRKAVTDASMNLQLRFYAVTTIEELPVTIVEAAITQPRAREGFHSVRYTADYLRTEAKPELLRIFRATGADNAPRIAHMDACCYCKAKATCPQALALVSDLAVTRIEELDIDGLEAMGDQIELAELVCKAWHRRMDYIADKKPELLKRYYPEPNNPVRTIEDAKAAFVKLFQAGGILSDDMALAIGETLDCCELSRYQLEAQLPKLRGKTGNQIKSELKTILGDLIVEKPRKPTLKKRKP